MSKASPAGPIPKELAGSSYWAGGRLVARRSLPKEVINAVAEWMAAEVEWVGYLSYETAAREILEKYRYGWSGTSPIYLETYFEREVRTNRFGHDYRAPPRLRIRPEVLKAFKRLTSKTVVSERDDRAWRKRKS
jgi:hypothetical protein